MKSQTARKRPQHRTLGTRLALLAGLASSLGLGTTARAEPDPPERLPAEMIAAQQLARCVQTDLRLAGAGGEASAEDYRLAGELLRSALVLASDDQAILRLALEAASAAGDSAREAEISRALVRLDPLDTVATLRLISTNISRLQTVEARLTVYDRMLGSDGDSLDVSVRSRLALDAALLLRERSDMDGFRRRLSEALELDPTNKDAATLTLNLALKDDVSPDQKLEAALFVIFADPYDQEAYQAALGLLLEHGAYDGAARMAKLSARLYTLLGAVPDGADRLRMDLAEFNSAGPEVVIGRLSEALARAREQAKQERALLEKAGKPVDTSSRPEELRLPVGSDRVRVVAAAALDDRERAGTFINELSESIKKEIASLQDPAQRPEGVSDEQARQAGRSALAELAWLRLLADVQTEAAGALIAELGQDPAADAAVQARLEAWLKLRTGEVAKAEAALSGLSRTDAQAVLGLAILAEKNGDVSLASARYRQVIERMPDQLAGAYARARYRQLAREPFEVSPEARALDAIARGIPDWLESMLESPRRAVTLEVTNLRRDMKSYERTPVRVRIKNASPIPLAMGPGKSIDTRFLFAPSVDIGTRRLPASDLLSVFNLDRRLRLLPQESVDAVVWPDQGLLSSALELSGSAQARVRWRVLQGFELVPGRGYEPCAYCLAADTPTLVRRPSGQFESVAEALKYALQTRSGGELGDSILSIVLKIATPDLPAKVNISPEDGDVLMEILARRFPTMQKASKVIVQTSLPTTTNFPPALRLEQVAGFETDEDVLAVQLALRTVQADDPIFSSATVKDSPRLREIARIAKSRLVAKSPSYATQSLRIVETVAPIPTLPLNVPIPLMLDQDRSGALLPIAPDPRPVPLFY